MQQKAERNKSKVEVNLEEYKESSNTAIKGGGVETKREK